MLRLFCAQNQSSLASVEAKFITIKLRFFCGFDIRQYEWELQKSYSEDWSTPSSYLWSSNIFTLYVLFVLESYIPAI